MTSALKAASAARRKANRARGKARDYERVRARAILPNTRVMITRRCHDRRMYLSAYGDPKKGHTAEETANFYGFTIARAVKKYGVSFHGGIQMGNHHHNTITDRLGNRPNYKNSVHGNLAQRPRPRVVSKDPDPGLFLRRYRRWPNGQPYGPRAGTVAQGSPSTPGITRFLPPAHMVDSLLCLMSGAFPEPVLP